MPSRIKTLVIAFVFTQIASAASAQSNTPTLPSAAVPKQEAAALAQGWVLLAEGKYEEASRTARSLATRFPRSAAALALSIEVDIARGGATTALDGYESWLGTRSAEEPAALRRVARAFLYEWGRQTGDAATRNQALLALAQDGDEEARALVGAGAAGLTARAQLGDDNAVDTLLARLKAAPGPKVNEIQMLAETGSKRAAAPLMAVLDDPMPENRAAAAAALGKLSHQEAVPALRRLLNESRGLVRVAAAGALYELGDTSGAPVLDELAGSEHASIRRSAALLMASQPSESWKALVRGLASADDPAIRLDAARLMAPHDPDFARAIFEQLAGDSNLAIREQAALTLAESPAAGFRDLRRLLRTAAGSVKVRAATRILAMTR